MRAPTTLALMATALLSAGAAAADQQDRAALGARDAEPAVELVWDWSVPHRFYVDTQVHLPQPIWFVAQFNKETRVVAFQVRAVLACGAGEIERRQVREVLCTIEDISLVAASMPKKEGLLQGILEEHDGRLTGAQVQLQVRDDGRVINVDLEGLDRRNQRVGDMNENLRLVLSRALAGLDLQLPKNGQLVDGIWAQYQNLLMQAPSAIGGSGASEIVHKIVQTRADGTMLIESAGRGVIVPGGELNNYVTEMAGFGTFDPAAGALLERTWTTVGLPSASSALAEGGEGIHYLQSGRLKLLGALEQVDVGPTVEVAPPGITSTTLQLWPMLGTTPTPMMVP